MRSISRTARRQSASPSHTRMYGTCSVNVRMTGRGSSWRSPCPPVIDSIAPAAWMVGPGTAPSATALARWTPRPPTSRTLVMPARSALPASIADRAPAAAGGSNAQRSGSMAFDPVTCAWQSHMPGMTVRASATAASPVSGAPEAGPAYVMHPPSMTTPPRSMGLPRPASSTSAPIRCLTASSSLRAICVHVHESFGAPRFATAGRRARPSMSSRTYRRSRLPEMHGEGRPPCLIGTCRRSNGFPVSCCWTAKCGRGGSRRTWPPRRAAGR